ncbi:hypothetical protein BT69DRAFT_909466 [Atractiella rhizophila]|nr:hypothetical protein BT69DRAFT_1281193 [Atractiella rhizophila]KAH8930293.1 hypothetical protein BT69DRAFT_909466 [Atractiella rhizophila]
MVSASSVFALSLSLLSAVTASHVVNVYNYCGEPKRGHVKSGSFNHISGLLSTNGGRQTVTIDERASSFIVFGESGECPGNDGPGCTRLECDFSNPNFQQCNLSRVAGWSIPLAWSWSNGGCTGGHCPSPSSGPADCWVPGVDDGRSIRQCNTPGVGINLYLCGA